VLPDLLGGVDFFVAPLAVADTLPWLLAALQGQPLVAVELALELAIAVAVEVVVAVEVAAVATTVVVEWEVGEVVEVAGAVASFQEEEEEVDVVAVMHQWLLYAQPHPTTLDYFHSRLKKKREQKGQKVVHTVVARRVVELFLHPLRQEQAGSQRRTCW